ncbi:glutamate racemase [Flaviaesturariibacter amylovorans]|uniref:Glutamate racemase n=1 Tax=Flaviaesturariibacter amylovorans TaxID=1084520 RepID=A0ABP8HQ19_9BACT
MSTPAPIGVFDSGYGGLTVLRSLVDRLPGYDYLYLGDNARAPYGNRSFDTVYRYTLQCVEWLLGQGCPLIILACNTASAKALRSIQQNDLARLDPKARVLGVIRPTAEVIGQHSQSGAIAVLATNGTVQSGSYLLEIEKFFPQVQVVQEACPMWVPLIENNEHGSPGADYFVRRHVDKVLQEHPSVDTLLLACTHYPLLRDKIRALLPEGVQVLGQGEIVAESLADYLQRHPEIEARLSKEQARTFFTTDAAADFDNKASIFFGESVSAQHVDLR